jgi:hypothetical protein
VRKRKKPSSVTGRKTHNTEQKMQCLTATGVTAYLRDIGGYMDGISLGYSEEENNQYHLAQHERIVPASGHVHDRR